MLTITGLPATAAAALKLMAKVQFRPFDDSDWMGWAGCESAEPMIGEIGDITVVLDGDTVTFNSYNENAGEPEWALFTLRLDEIC